MEILIDWDVIEHRVVKAVLAAYRTKNLSPQRGHWNLHVSAYRLDDRGTLASPLRGCCPQTAILVGAYPTFKPDEKLDPEFHIYDHAVARALDVPVGYARGFRLGFDLYPATIAVNAEACLRPETGRIEGAYEGYQAGLRLGCELASLAGETPPDIRGLLRTQNEATAALFKAFGYVEQYRVFPVEDNTEQHWMIFDDVLVAHSPEPFTAESIEGGTAIYTGHIYTQRHLSRWIYRTATHTMALVDTRCDGNILLMVFDNANECRDPALRAAFEASGWR